MSRSCLQTHTATGPPRAARRWSRGGAGASCRHDTLDIARNPEAEASDAACATMQEMATQRSAAVEAPTSRNFGPASASFRPLLLGAVGANSFAGRLRIGDSQFDSHQWRHLHHRLQPGVTRQPDDALHARAIAPVDEPLAASPRAAAENDAHLGSGSSRGIATQGLQDHFGVTCLLFSRIWPWWTWSATLPSCWTRCGSPNRAIPMCCFSRRSAPYTWQRPAAVQGRGARI